MSEKPERCPPSRCEIHLEKSIDDGFKWARVVQESGICMEIAEKAQDHYEKAKKSMKSCAMREAFDHLRSADMERQKVLRCMQLEEDLASPTISSGSFAGLTLGKPPRRPALQGSKRKRSK